MNEENRIIHVPVDKNGKLNYRPFLNTLFRDREKVMRGESAPARELEVVKDEHGKKKLKIRINKRGR